MLRFASLTACATFSAYVASSTIPNSLFSAPVTVVLCGFGTATAWHLCGTFLRWMYRNDRDAALMNGGFCPSCESRLTLEVTSERHDPRETDVRCSACTSCYTVIASEGGPLVKRHGKGYEFDYEQG